MAQQTIALPRENYFVRETRRREWDWTIRSTTDPPIDDSLTSSSNPSRYLAQIRLWRDINTGSRILIMHLEQTPSDALSTGENLSDEFTSHGSITVTLPSGESITALQRLSGDQTEQYRYDAPGHGFTHEEFDAFWNALGNTGETAATLVIRDFEPAPFSEGLGVSDSVSSDLQPGVIVSETLGVAEGPGAGQDIVSSVGESLGVADEVTSGYSLPRIIPLAYNQILSSPGTVQYWMGTVPEDMLPDSSVDRPIDMTIVDGLSRIELDIGLVQGQADQGTLFSLPRIPGVSSTVTATITGAASTVIPSGSRARTLDGAIFFTTQQVIIGSTGTVDVLMRAVEIGPIVAGVNTLTQIVDSIPGWTEVTNVAAATLGRNQETDHEYRRRYRSEVAVHSGDSLESIRARVLNTPGVTGCIVRDNSTNAAVTVQNVAIAARSLLVIVEGGVEYEVGKAISETKTVGVPTVGDRLVNVTHDQGFTIPIRFRRVRNIPIQVAINLTPDDNRFPSTGFLTMRDNLLQWFSGTWDVIGFDTSGVGIGETVDLERLNSPLNAVSGHRLNSVAVTRVGGGALGSPDLDQRYTLMRDNVTFTISSS